MCICFLLVASPEFLLKACNQSLLHHIRVSLLPRTARWNAEDLLDYFQAYLHMKNTDGVKEVVSILNRMACRRSQPKDLLVEGTPGNYLLKQLFVCVDLALMLMKRRQERQAETTFRYFTVDSSPQGNRNWLLSKSTGIKVNDMIIAGSLSEAVFCR